MKTHRRIFVASLVLLVVAMTTSAFFANLAWVLLLLNWLLEGRWHDKFANFSHNYLLHFFLLLFVIHVVGLVWSGNWQYGLYDIQKKLPLLCVPLVLLTTPRLSRHEQNVVMGFYAITVLVVTIIGLCRYLSIPELPYRKIVPYISHIRFSLNLCFVIVLSGAQVLYVARIKKCRWWMLAAATLLVAWMVAFLFLIRSYTGLCVLAILGPVLLLAYGWHRLPHGVFWIAAVTMIVAYSLLAGTVVGYVHDYYRLSPQSVAPLSSTTANGNSYSHRCDGLVENGSFVNNYVCEAELRSQWEARSTMTLSQCTPNGYPVLPTLVRYLNALWLPKDSSGVAALSDADVSNIEQGIANPVYAQHRPLRKMVYVILFERECGLRLGSVKDFSLLQRLELWHTGIATLSQYPFFGTGTGDVVDCVHHQLEEAHSPLSGTDLHLHNQYLSFLVAFGIVGGLLLASVFLRAFVKQRLFKQPFYMAHLAIVLLSCVTEDTFETLAGCLFVAVFAAIWSPSSSSAVPDAARNGDALLYNS